MRQAISYFLILFCSGLSSPARPGDDTSPPSRLNVQSIQFLGRSSGTVLAVRLNNQSYTTIKPDIWAEIYDDAGRLVGRFSGNGAPIKAKSSATVEIELGTLKIGKYKAIVAGKYLIPGGQAELPRSTMFVEYLPGFTLAINRNKEIVVAEDLRRHDAAIVPPTDILASRETAALDAPVKRATKQGQHPSAEDVAIKQRQAVTQQLITKQSQRDIGKNVPDNRPNNQKKSLTTQQYTVKRGDWLSKIASRFYGDMMKYNIIYEANRNIISEPDLIYPGQRLQIPSQEEGSQLYACSKPHVPLESAGRLEKEQRKAGALRMKLQRRTQTTRGLFVSGFFFDQNDLGAIIMELKPNIVHQGRKDENATPTFLEQVLGCERVADLVRIKPDPFIFDAHSELTFLKQELYSYFLAGVLPVAV